MNQHAYLNEDGTKWTQLRKTRKNFRPTTTK